MLLSSGAAYAQHREYGKIAGRLKLDSSWDKVIYLSHIPTFNDMHTISNENIISRAVIDSFGYFEFDTGFIPEEDNLFRLHITRKGDAPASLVIGGKDENHLFFVANRHNDVYFEANAFYPPFRKITFTQPGQNSTFQKITSLVNVSDSIAAESGAAKRKFIENKLYEELLSIADTAANPLVSLYAIYRAKFESRYTADLGFYESYLNKWEGRKDSYFTSFRNQVHTKTESSYVAIGIIFSCTVFAFGFFAGRYKVRKKSKVETLSTQERKIFELLRQGATNQEISDQCHIEISTVKSHVSNIFSKLNVKSRKEIMNISALPQNAISAHVPYNSA
ncbi:hypothetical protein WSM22_31920 [Cytophagales bacterium WSM2-2]|nr:hypothetical protein WSM22_31920 [Cytophagales bacterium WSM2-2]